MKRDRTDALRCLKPGNRHVILWPSVVIVNASMIIRRRTTPIRTLRLCPWSPADCWFLRSMDLMTTIECVLQHMNVLQLYCSLNLIERPWPIYLWLAINRQDHLPVWSISIDPGFVFWRLLGWGRFAVILEQHFTRLEVLSAAIGCLNEPRATEANDELHSRAWMEVLQIARRKLAECDLGGLGALLHKLRGSVASKGLQVKALHEAVFQMSFAICRHPHVCVLEVFRLVSLLWTVLAHDARGLDVAATTSWKGRHGNQSGQQAASSDCMWDICCGSELSRFATPANCACGPPNTGCDGVHHRSRLVQISE